MLDNCLHKLRLLAKFNPPKVVGKLQVNVHIIACLNIYVLTQQMMEVTEIKKEEPDREENDPFSQIEYVASAIVSEVNGVPEVQVSNLTTQSWPSRLATVFDMPNDHLQSKSSPSFIYNSNKWIHSSHQQVGTNNMSKKRKIEELSDIPGQHPDTPGQPPDIPGQEQDMPGHPKNMPGHSPLFVNKMNSISALLNRDSSQPNSCANLLKQLLSTPSPKILQPVDISIPTTKLPQPGDFSIPSPKLPQHGVLSIPSPKLSQHNDLSIPSPKVPQPGDLSIPSPKLLQTDDLSTKSPKFPSPRVLFTPSGDLSTPSPKPTPSSIHSPPSPKSPSFSPPSPISSPTPCSKSASTHKPLPPLRRISEFEIPSVDDKEAIDILTGCGADISDDEDDIVNKPPAFAFKIKSVDQLLEPRKSVSSDDTMVGLSMETQNSPDNIMYPIEEEEHENIDEPNGDDILARLNDLDEPYISSTKLKVEKIEIPKEDYNNPLDLVKRKVESIQNLLNPNEKCSTSPQVDASSKKDEPLKKHKKKSKPEIKIREIIDDGEERYRRYDPKIEITKLMALLLRDKEYNPSVIKWVDSSKGIFHITNTSEFAKLRGKQRNSNTYMEFKHVNRNIRYHTHEKSQGKGTGKLLSIPGQRLTYQFTDKMEFDWKPRSDDCMGNPNVLDYHKLGI